jgi:hypothetical protein
MVERVIVQLVDDIDGSVLDDETGETIDFAVNGVEYSIDLNAKNAKEFHNKLDYYIEHGIRVEPSPTGPPVPRDRTQTRAIRQWASDQGYRIRTRGRISAEIERAYRAAH